MQHVLTVKQMRQADASAMGDYKIPGVILMENAARSAADYLDSIFEIGEIGIPDVDIICGSGNNGGDGFALARHLHEKYSVRIIWIGSVDKMSPETHTNFVAMQKLGIINIHISNVKDLTKIEFSRKCVIDAMIGVGGSENIKGIANDILNKIGNNPVLKVALDAPTGLNTETGMAAENCFKSDYTITMFAVKTGMLLNDGPDYCGEILTAYLGATEKIVKEIANIKILGDEDLETLIPFRKRVSSKFDYGRVLVIAGSRKYPGAAALCANAAIKAGAGLVQLLSNKIHHAVLPEVIAQTIPENTRGSISIKAGDIIMESIEKADVIALGPGLSDDDETIKLIKKLIKEIPKDKSIVIDADGLRAIDKNSKLRKNIILTPHTIELSRLTGNSIHEVEINSNKIASDLASTLNCTVVLKHVPVIITDSNNTYWNLTGNPGMASGGTGDVLTGLIAGLVAQHISPLNAAALGVFFHAKAGDLYLRDFSEETLTASALLNLLPEAMVIK